MRRTKEEAEKTRLEIIKSAVKVFSEKGFTSSTLVDIAKEANVTRGAIYWHFKNKNDLFEALIDENESKINAIIREVRDKEKNPLIVLKVGMIKILNKMDSDPEYRAIENLIIKSKFAGEIEFIHERFTKDDFEGVCLMREILTEYKNSTKRKNFDVEKAIQVIGAFVYGAMIIKLNAQTSSPFNFTGPMDEYVTMFFKGIENC